MKSMKKNYRRLFEEQKPQMIVDLEKCFGNNILYDEKPYEPSEADFELLFNILNHGLFYSKLPHVDKIILKAGEIKDKRFHGADNAFAGFVHGFRNGMETNMFVVKQPVLKINFFTLVSTIIHEMIHMYDYYHGPLHAQLVKYAAVGQYNLNYPDERTGEKIPYDMKGQKADLIRSAINLANMLYHGLNPKQVPDEIQNKIKEPSLDHMPRQYAFPAEIKHIRDPKTGKYFEIPYPLPKKYDMHMIDGFYDLHGQFFQQIANKANQIGFVVEDVFSKYTATKMQKVYEFNEKNLNSQLFDFFKTEDYKYVDIKDADNWFFCIS